MPSFRNTGPGGGMSARDLRRAAHEIAAARPMLRSGEGGDGFYGSAGQSSPTAVSGGEPARLVRVTGPAAGGEYPVVLVTASAAGVEDGEEARLRLAPADGHVPTTGDGYVLALPCGPAADPAYGLYVGAAPYRLATVVKDFEIACDPDTGGILADKWFVDVLAPIPAGGLAWGDDPLGWGGEDFTFGGG